MGWKEWCFALEGIRQRKSTAVRLDIKLESSKALK